MDPEIPYVIAANYLISVLLLFMGGLPVKVPFSWRAPKGVTFGASVFKIIESLVGKARVKASPFLSPRDRTMLAVAWRGNFSYSVPLFGFVDSFFRNSDALSSEQREARSFYCTFALLSFSGASMFLLITITVHLLNL